MTYRQQLEEEAPELLPGIHPDPDKDEDQCRRLMRLVTLMSEEEEVIEEPSKVSDTN